MAEVVHRQLELMVPELELLIDTQLFSKEEVKEIIKKRTRTEYALKRRVGKKSDFLRAIEMEMNLHELLLKRLESKKPKNKRVQVVFIKRITSLFERVLLRFRGDLVIWLQYIDFVKRQKNIAFLGVLFGRAIQTFPANPDLWIMAAAWEFESNNIAACRVLLQRGLRLNPDSEELWLKYFGMELTFLDAMRAAHKNLGNEQATSEARNAIESLVSVPTLTSSGETNATLEDMMEKNMFEETADFYQGAIPKLVFHNAIKQLPESINLRSNLIAVARCFSLTKALQDEIYQSIRKDFPDHPEALAIACRRPYEENPSLDVNKTAKALESSCALFEETLKAHPSTELWELYVSFFQTVTNKRREEFAESKNTYLEVKGKAILESASHSNLVSEERILEWVLLTLKEASADSVTRALEVVELGLARFPFSEQLWLLKMKLIIQVKYPTDIVFAFLDVFKLLPERNAKELWHLYLLWLISHPEVFDKTVIQGKFEDALWTTPVGNDPIKTLYLTWARAALGLEKFRELMIRLVNLPMGTEAFILKCISLEKAERTTDLSKQRVLYEALVSKSPKNGDFWLEYMKAESEGKQFERVNNLHWRAMKVVDKVDEFIVKYNQMA